MQLDKVDHVFKAFGHGLIELLGRTLVIARPGKQIAQHKRGNLGKADAGGFQWLDGTLQGNAIEANGILTGNSNIRYFKSEADYTRYIDSVDTYIKSRTPEQLSQIKKEGFLEHIQNMEANQTKHFRSILVWDKRRYHRNDAIEYYIEEKEKHFIELHINLMTEELLMSFTEAEKKELLKDKTLTKGWFTSNKMEIDLGE